VGPAREGAPLNPEEYEVQYRLEDSYWWFVGRRRIICSWLADMVKPSRDGLLLDIGCGTGTTLSSLRRFGRVLGLDSSELALARAQSRGLNRLVQGAAQHLPYADGSFDVITMLDVLEHLDEEATTLTGIYRVLRPGGSLLLTVPAFPSLWSQHDVALHHRRRYRSTQLRELLADSRFDVARMTHAICPVAPMTFVFRWLQNACTSPSAPKTALIELPDSLNRFLISLLTVEAQLVRSVSLPFGVSLLCQAVKPA